MEHLWTIRPQEGRIRISKVYPFSGGSLRGIQFLVGENLYSCGVFILAYGGGGGNTNKGIVTDYMGVPACSLGDIYKRGTPFHQRIPTIWEGEIPWRRGLNSLAISISWRGLFSEVCFLVGFIFPDDFPSVGRSVSGSLGEGLRFLEIFHGGYSQAGVATFLKVLIPRRSCSLGSQQLPGSLCSSEFLLLLRTLYLALSTPE